MTSLLAPFSSLFYPRGIRPPAAGPLPQLWACGLAACCLELRGLEGLLEVSWERPGSLWRPSWGPSGASWAPLGALSEPMWRALVAQAGFSSILGHFLGSIWVPKITKSDAQMKAESAQRFASCFLSFLEASEVVIRDVFGCILGCFFSWGTSRNLLEIIVFP